MLEAAEELWRWLDNGAYFYVCGDAKRMAGDVNLAVHQIAVTRGGMDSAGDALSRGARARRALSARRLLK
jgi:sulfite reductase (NADPH) flavoprotein alpha-component